MTQHMQLSQDWSSSSLPCTHMLCPFERRASSALEFGLISPRGLTPQNNPLCRSPWRELILRWSAWAQPAGYNVLRNLMGMQLGPSPTSQLQPKQLCPSYLIGKEWEPQLQFSAGGEEGNILSKWWQALSHKYVCGIQLYLYGYIWFHASAGQKRMADKMCDVPWNKSGFFEGEVRWGNWTHLVFIPVAIDSSQMEMCHHELCLC